MIYTASNLHKYLDIVKTRGILENVRGTPTIIHHKNPSNPDETTRTCFYESDFITKGSDGERVRYSCNPNVNLSTMHLRLSSFIKHNGYVYALEGISRSVVKMTFDGCIVKAHACSNKNFSTIDVREDCVFAYNYSNVCTSVKLNLDLEFIEDVVFDMCGNDDPNIRYDDMYVLDRDRFICRRVTDGKCSIVIFNRNRILECIREIKFLDGDTYTFNPNDHINVLNCNLIIVRHEKTISIVDINRRLCLHRSKINTGEHIRTISETEFNIKGDCRVECRYVSKYDGSMVKDFIDTNTFSEKVVLEDNDEYNGFSLGECVSYILGWNDIY